MAASESRRSIGVIVALAVALLAVGAATARAAPAVDGEFALSDQPGQLTLGPDGNVWVVFLAGANDLAKVEPDGTVTEYNPADVAGAKGITAGPDGNLWVSQTGGVAKVPPANPNAAQKFTIAAIAGPRGITAGPDGNLWAASGDKVVKIPPANPAANTVYTIAGLNARGIASGTDGRLWVADFGGGRIVSVATDGTPTFHPVGGGPQQVAAGPGGQVAYTNPGANPQVVGRLFQGGSPLSTQTPMADPFGIALAVDGAYWTAQFAAGNLGRLTTGGQYTTLGGLGAGAGPRYLTAGLGGTLWVSLETAKRIARVSGIEPAPPPGPPSPPSPPPGLADTSVSLELRAKRKQRLRRLFVRASCGNEACTIRATGRVKAKPKGSTKRRAADRKAKVKRFKLRRHGARVAAGETKKLRLKLKRKPRRRLERLLHGGARAKATVRVRATDAAGNRSRERLRIRLKH
ncbi:MAG: hypothetical protein GEU88_17620 [Solirubrobacterales bacterium]|nr:hypothetical protein [Solirubrobacterales bacterium]